MTNFRITASGVWVKVPLENVMVYHPPSNLARVIANMRRRSTFSAGSYQYKDELADWIKDHNCSPAFQMYGGSEYVDVLFPIEQHDIALLFKLTWGGE